MTKPSDRQVGGNHYKQIKPEPWEVMHGWDKEHFIGFLRYCAVKRLARWDSKDGALQDVRKAIHELQRLEEILAEEEKQILAEAEIETVRVSGVPYEVSREELNRR